MSHTNPSQPSGKSWRRGAQGQTPSRAPPGRRRGWTQRTDRTYERAALRYRLKIAAWLALALLLVAGFVVWLVWTPLRTPFLVATVTNYGPPISPNAWAREDVERFHGLDQAEVLKCSEVPWESSETGVRELRRQLDSAPPGGPDKNLVIVYLSMHGAVNAAGEPCLLPPGASASDSSQWLRVRELLDDLFGQGQTGSRGDKVRKLLVLDANRMDANWRLGLLYNGFADRLPLVVEEANIPNLVVLSSAGPGQIGWAAPELTGSVFGYFFWQGLKGAADVEKTGNGDRIVSLRELYDYLQAHVGQWVRENRSDIQRPLLLPDTVDFPLVHARSRDTTVLPEPEPARDARWSEVSALWQLHEQLRRQVPDRWNPLGWAECQHKLLRLEQLLEAGKAYEAEFSDTRKELESLTGTLAQGPPRQELAMHSLPLARQWGRWPSDIELQQLPAPWRKSAGKPGDVDPPAKAEEKVEAKPAGKAAAKSKTSGEKPADGVAADAPAAELPSPATPPELSEPRQPKPAPRYGYLAAASEGWNWFGEHPERGKLPELFQFLDRADRNAKTDLVEVHFLRMLDAHLEATVWTRGARSVQRALAVRNLAEQAAAPLDERTLYWAVPLVDQADQQRRLAEDHLFVGTRKKLLEADAAWNKAAGEDDKSGTYQEALEQTRRFAEALKLRDTLWAEVPYLAEWRLARLREGGPPDEDLQGLLTATQTWAAALDDALQRESWTPELNNMGPQVESRRTTWQRVFSKACSDLETAGEDRQTLRVLGTVLAVPLVTGPQRNELRDKYLRIRRQQAANAGSAHQVALNENADDRATAGEEGSAGSRYLERLAAWTVHPALQVLDRANGSAGDAPSQLRVPGTAENSAKLLAAAGEEVRRLLRTLPSAAEERLAETNRLLAATGAEAATPVTVRAGCSQADRWVRAAAPLLGRQPWSDLNADPVRRLGSIDRYFLLLWHAKRTLDDFWGPAPEHDRSFFAAAARDDLESAQELCHQATGPAWGPVDLAAQLVEREKTAQEGIQSQSRDLAIIPDEPYSKHGLAVTLAAGLPPGEAAVYLDGLQGRELPLRVGEQPVVERLDVPVGGASTHQLEYQVDLAGVSGLQAVALYRGHVYRRDLVVERPLSGVEIASVPTPATESVLTVYGQAWQRTSVLFVFDCSGSMLERVTLERGRKEPRIKLARQTLEAILERLANSEKPYDVGVMLYGRRVGWNPAPGRENELVIRDPNNPDRFLPKPDDLDVHPSDDVETILRLGPFTQAKRREVNRELDASQPMGETPLYLSIVRAIESFPPESASGRRHIVVITDGFNEQSSGGTRGVMKFRKDVEDLLRRPGNQGTHLDIVGFNLAPRDAGERQSLKDLQALTTQTGGVFYSVQDPSGLLKALEKSLNLLQYIVRPAGGGASLTPQPLELGTTCRIDSSPDRPRAYVAEIADTDRPAQAEVVIVGGESLELYLADDPRTGQRRLIHHRYDTDSPSPSLREARENVPDPLDPDRPVYLGAHLPEWQGTSLRFPLSVQNADAALFSPRPAEAWVQIKPILPKGSKADRVYPFYDLSFEPERPVPVLSCLASNWPVEAKQAEISVWCKFTKTTPDKIIALAQLPGEPIRLDSVPDVTLEVELKRGSRPEDPWQVNVVERHPVGPDLVSLKVDLEPFPNKIIHRFNPAAGTVRHTFFCNASAATIDTYSVRLTARKRLFEKAVAPPQPFVVTVPRLTIPVER